MENMAGKKKWQSRNGDKPKADKKQYVAEDRQYASRKETGVWKGSDRERERATDEWGKSFQAGYKDIEAGKKYAGLLESAEAVKCFICLIRNN